MRRLALTALLLLLLLLLTRAASVGTKKAMKSGKKAPNTKLRLQPLSSVVAAAYSMPCSSTADCWLGTYCDKGFHCYQCSYITKARCDDHDHGSCCSAVFLQHCVGNPHECAGPLPPALPPLPPPCLNQPPGRHEEWQSNCYPGQGASCAVKCDHTSNWTASYTCFNSSSCPSYPNTPCWVNESSYEPPTAEGFCVCTAHADCSAGEYCDDSGSCRPCSPIYPSRSCDALGHDCCSADFLRQCTGNPYKTECCANSNPQRCSAPDGDCCSAPFLQACPDDPFRCSLNCTTSKTCATGEYCVNRNDYVYNRSTGKREKRSSAYNGGVCTSCPEIGSSSNSMREAIDKGGFCSDTVLRHCPRDPWDCAGLAPITFAVGLACGAATATAWVVIYDRSLLRKPPERPRSKSNRQLVAISVAVVIVISLQFLTEPGPLVRLGQSLAACLVCTCLTMLCFTCGRYARRRCCLVPQSSPPRIAEHLERNPGWDQDATCCCCHGAPELSITNRVYRGIFAPVVVSFLAGWTSFICAAATIFMQPWRGGGCTVGLGCNNYLQSLQFLCGYVAAGAACVPSMALTLGYCWSLEAYEAIAAKPDLLHGHKLRPVWFMRAYRWCSVAATLLPPFFQLQYMAHEMHIFVYTLGQQALDQSDHVSPYRRRDLDGRHNREPVSVDGVRALAPVVVVLNAFTAAIVLLAGVLMFTLRLETNDYWFLFMYEHHEFEQYFVAVASYFNAGDSLGWSIWEPAESFFWGVLTAWLLTSGVIILGVTAVLVHGLSEPRVSHESTRGVEDVRTSLLRATVLAPSEPEAERRPWFARLLRWATSWHGQTELSIANHLATIATLLWGVFFVPLNDTIYTLLVVASILSSLGVFISITSLCGRKYPHWKILPSDDSFRATCAIKTTLVLLKAGIIFGLGDVPSASDWEGFVTILFFTSFFVVALTTLALSGARLWRNPQVLSAAGIANPKLFLMQYMMSFIAAKLGILVIMVSGSAPAAFGCHSTLFLLPTFPDGCEQYGDGYRICNSSCDSYDGNKRYIPCTWHPATVTSCPNPLQDGQHCTSCKARFFSTVTLTPLLVSLLWVPFAIYHNNEVAQLLDGLWWKHQQRSTAAAHQRQASSSMSINMQAPQETLSESRVGLSTALHGCRAVSPLTQTVILICTIASFAMWEDPTEYELPNLGPPDTFDAGKRSDGGERQVKVFTGWPQGLRWFVLVGVGIANGLMLLRTLLSLKSCLVEFDNDQRGRMPIWRTSLGRWVHPIWRTSLGRWVHPADEAEPELEPEPDRPASGGTRLIAVASQSAPAAAAAAATAAAAAPTPLRGATGAALLGGSE